MKAVEKQNVRDPYLNFEQPQLWQFNRELYPELSDKDIEWMESLPFDWGDIMAVAGYFFTKDQICSCLNTNNADINEYVLKIVGKDWTYVYESLWWKAQCQGRDLIKEFANQGNATAMGLLGHQIMKLDREEQAKAMKITIVNDLDENKDSSDSE